jgi:hypothetical protein
MLLNRLTSKAHLTITLLEEDKFFSSNLLARQKILKTKQKSTLRNF